MTVRDQPILTDIYPTVDDFVPDADSVYISGTSVEERSVHSVLWESNATARRVQFLRITDQQTSTIEVEIHGARTRVALRSSEQLRHLWAKFPNRAFYLDITGLAHHVWAPLLKSALLTGTEFRAVYIEPFDYKFRSNPIEGEIFDLSEKINGVLPIPGFASLTATTDDNVCFVPLVGFEGTRLSYIIEQVQPPGGKILPIVGIPGFLPHEGVNSFV